jgi:hypothetical protein
LERERKKIHFFLLLFPENILGLDGGKNLLFSIKSQIFCRFRRKRQIKLKKKRSLENKQSINLNLFSAFQQFLPFWMKRKNMEMPFFIFFFA